MSHFAPPRSAAKLPTAASDSVDVTLLSNEPKQHEAIEQYKPRRSRQYVCLLVTFIAVVTLLAITAGIYSNNQQKTMRQSHNDLTFSAHFTTPTKSNDKPHPCGTSASEARARNCTFDQLTWAWLPPSCTLYASDRFVSAGTKPWVYWQDLERTIPVETTEWEEVLDGERTVLSERREHLTHCIFMYVSLAHLLDSGGTYWERLIELEHHEHCAKMLLGAIREGYGLNQGQLKTRDDSGMWEGDDGGWESLNSMIGGASFDQDCEGNLVHVLR